MGSNISKDKPPDPQNQELKNAEQSIVSVTKSYTIKSDALKLFTEPLPDQAFNVLKLKIVIQEEFNELSSIHLKKLQQKFKKRSVVLFIAANNDTRFYIYWKSKDSRKVLSLKPNKECFFEADKDLCDFVAEFLTNCIQNGHSGIHPDQDNWTNKGQIELQNLVDSRNYNLLLLASESGNAKPIEALLKYGIEPRVNLPIGEITAQELAWQGRHSNLLLKLCQANLAFPPQIDINECSEDLKRFIETCQEFHKMIEDQNKDRLNEILQQNPNLRYFYDLSNKSALKAALDLKLIDMYEFLISKNLSFGPHEDTDEIWDQFESPEKIEIRNINLKFLKDIEEKHISCLMSNTSLSHDEKDAVVKKELILRAYKTLNSDPRLKIILKVVAATKIFKIIFDFHRDSTYRIDPTTAPETQGICYFTGRIIVGAKQLLNPDTEHDAFGVLIHEFCHYAMVAVYQNKARPFAANDQEAKDEFDRIIEECEAKADEEEVIGSVYEYYGEEQHPVELIVRPPHLIALYSKEPGLLQEAIENFNQLFDYYLNVVVPAMERALPEIESRLVYRPTQTYEKLTDQDKEEVQNAIVKYKNVEVKFIELFPSNSDIFEALTSDHISLMLDEEVLNFEDPQFRYLEEQIELKWENLAGNLKEKILDSDLNFQGEIVKFKDLFEVYSGAFDALTSQQIVNVLSGNELKIGMKFVSENKFYIERKFIPEVAKLMAFEYKYGHKYVKNYKTDAKHFNNKTKNKSFLDFSDEFLKKDFDEISQILDKVKQNFYFRTRFYNLNSEDFHFMHKTFTEIVKQAGKQKIFILSSEPGAGKTVTFEHLTMEIKSKFPTRWVSYIDLPKYTKFYNSNGTAENLKKKILKLNSQKNNFEVRIFEESFKSGNLVLIWNAFDEISPAYNEFILNYFKSIFKNSTNVQLVCTRPLYSDQLSKAFKIRTWQLVPFDEEKIQEFLSEFFKFENVSSEKIEENIEKIEIILEKFEFDQVSFPYNFDTPLMLRFIAEIHENEKLFESANIYGIFEAFVQKKIEIWLEKKIEIWLEKSKRSLSIAKKWLLSGSSKTVLQKFALLNELRLFSNTTLALKMRKLQIMQKEMPKDFQIEEISQLGILFINGKNNFQFSHKTLSEFFVAQFFIENVFDVDGIDNDEAELRLELFFYLTKCYGSNQQIITDFMMSYLQMRPQSPKKFNPTISKLLRTKFKNFFIRMLDTNHPEVFEFLFEFFKPDHKLLVDLLHVNESETFYTAIFNPNHFALFTNPEEIKNLAQNYLTDTEFKKFLTGKNQKGKVLFGINFYGLLGIKKYNHTYNSEIDHSFLDFFLKFFVTRKNIFINLEKARWTNDEYKEYFVAALNPKIYLFYDKLFSINEFSKYENLWTNLEHVLTKNEMQNAIGDALVHCFEIYSCQKESHEKFLNFLLQKAVKFLSKSQIFEMFLNKKILHEASGDPVSFNILWIFLGNHTNEEERKKILLQDNFNRKTFYYNKLKKEDFSSYFYQYFYYDFTRFNMFHKVWIFNEPETLNFMKAIYQKHFSKSEIQEIILSSNDFLYYVIGNAGETHFKIFYLFLNEIFEGNENLLQEFLKREIEPTNLSGLELVEEFRGLPYANPNWFDNLKKISNVNLFKITQIKQKLKELGFCILLLIVFIITDYIFQTKKAAIFGTFESVLSVLYRFKAWLEQTAYNF